MSFCVATFPATSIALTRKTFLPSLRATLADQYSRVVSLELTSPELKTSTVTLPTSDTRPPISTEPWFVDRVSGP
jgi:hypothetical protein